MYRELAATRGSQLAQLEYENRVLSQLLRQEYQQRFDAAARCRRRRVPSRLSLFAVADWLTSAGTQVRGDHVVASAERPIEMG
jgi:hypothetical protein